ncbi:hypothetical protein M8J76_000276 [Diaphorina citri]|nr:hypothetical protein M8J76_000276 [Diaphorina citri]
MACDRCVQLSSEVEKLTTQNKKIVQLLNVEDYKKEKIKIKELAIKVKNTTKESVLRNVPKQIDECSALYINKTAEIQNYIRATEIARAAKQELETRSLELEGNKMYVKQLVAKVDELEHNKRTLTESLASTKLLVTKALMRNKKIELEMRMLNDAHSYHNRVETGVKKALRRLESSDPNSTKSCLRILNNLVHFFEKEPLFVKRSRKLKNGADNKGIVSPHSVSSGYSSGTASPWSTPYNTPQSSEEPNTQFTFTFTPDGDCVLSPLPAQSQSNPSTSSSSTPATRSSITSPLVQPSPPHSSYEPSQNLSSEEAATSWSMSCDSSDDEIVDGADDRDSDVESDRETSIKNTCKLETNKHKSKDLGDLASDKVKETRELQSDKGKSSPKRGELDSDMVEISERSKKPSSDNVQSTFDLVGPNDMCESNKIDCDNSDEGKSSDIQEITVASEVASPKHASAELLHLPVLENFEDEKPTKQLPGVTSAEKDQALPKQTVQANHSPEAKKHFFGSYKQSLFSPSKTPPGKKETKQEIAREIAKAAKQIEMSLCEEENCVKEKKKRVSRSVKRRSSKKSIGDDETEAESATVVAKEKKNGTSEISSEDESLEKLRVLRKSRKSIDKALKDNVGSTKSPGKSPRRRSTRNKSTETNSIRSETSCVNSENNLIDSTSTDFEISNLSDSDCESTDLVDKAEENVKELLKIDKERHEHVLQIFKDIEVMQNVELISNFDLLASPCKKQTRSRSNSLVPNNEADKLENDVVPNAFDCDKDIRNTELEKEKYESLEAVCNETNKKLMKDSEGNAQDVENDCNSQVEYDECKTPSLRRSRRNSKRNAEEISSPVTRKSPQTQNTESNLKGTPSDNKKSRKSRTIEEERSPRTRSKSTHKAVSIPEVDNLRQRSSSDVGTLKSSEETEISLADSDEIPRRVTRRSLSVMENKEDVKYSEKTRRGRNKKADNSLLGEAMPDGDKDKISFEDKSDKNSKDKPNSSDYNGKDQVVPSASNEIESVDDLDESMEINDIDASVETLSEITDKSSGIDTEKNLVKQIEPEKEEMVDNDKSGNLERTLLESRVEITESNKEDVEGNDSMVQDVRCLKRTRIALSKVGGDAVSKVSSDTLDTVSKVSDENKALSPPEKAVSYPLESKKTPDKSAPSTAQPMSPQNDKKLETDAPKIPEPVSVLEEQSSKISDPSPVLQLSTGRKFKIGRLKEVSNTTNETAVPRKELADSRNIETSVESSKESPSTPSSRKEHVELANEKVIVGKEDQSKCDTNTDANKVQESNGDEVRSDEHVFKVPRSVKLHRNLLSVDKFNKISGTIMSKPVLFVSSGSQDDSHSNGKVKYRPETDKNPKVNDIPTRNNTQSLFKAPYKHIPIPTVHKIRSNKNILNTKNEKVLANKKDTVPEDVSTNENGQNILNHTVNKASTKNTILPIVKTDNLMQQNRITQSYNCNLNLVKPVTVQKPPHTIVNSKKVNRILRRMGMEGFNKKFPFIDALPATPPQCRENGTGFKTYNGYNNSTIAKEEVEEMEETDCLVMEMEDDLQDVREPKDADSEVSEQLSSQTTCEDKVPVPDMTQPLADKEEVVEKSISLPRKKGDELNQMPVPIPNITDMTQPLVEKERGVEKSPNRSQRKDEKLNFVSKIMENSLHKEDQIQNKEIVPNHSTSFLNVHIPDQESSNSLTKISNDLSPNKSDDTTSLTSTTSSGLKSPSNLLTSNETPCQSLQSPPSIFPKCIQNRLAEIRSTHNLPIYNITPMSNLAHNTRPGEKTNMNLGVHGLKSNEMSPPSLNKVDIKDAVKPVQASPTDISNQVSYNNNPEPTLVGNQTFSFYGQKITAPFEKESTVFRPPNNFSNTNTVSRPSNNVTSNSDNMVSRPPNNLNTSFVNNSPPKVNGPLENCVHQANATKPMEKIVLPTLSFYNTRNSPSYGANKRKCEDPEYVSSDESKKLRTELETSGRLKSTVNTPKDKDEPKSYTLIQRSIEHLQSEMSKPDVTPTNQIKTKTVTKKLNLLYYAMQPNDKNVFDRKIKAFVKELEDYPLDTLSKRIIALYDNKQLVDNPKAVTNIQTKVFCLIIQLNTTRPEFLPTFMKTLHETLVLHSETTLLSILYALTQLYVGLCRWRNDPASVMTFLYDTIYFHRKRSLNILDALITRWPTVYPVASRCVLVKVMSCILLNQQTSSQGSFLDDQNIFVKTKQQLRTKYRYQEQFTLAGLLAELMNMLKSKHSCCSNPWQRNSRSNSHHQGGESSSFSGCVQRALVLLAKHWRPAPDLYSVVVERNLATLFRSSLDCGAISVAASCAELMGMIGKAMPRASSLLCIVSLLDILEVGLQHPACRSPSPLRTSIGRALTCLTAHNTERCVAILTSVPWTEAEVNDLVKDVAAKVIAVKNLDWWKEMLEREGSLPKV